MQPLARYAVATVLTGVAAGVLGAALTLLLHAVQHLAFGYTENTFLVGVEKASPVRRVVAMAVGGVVVGVGWWLHRRRVDIEQVSVTRAVRDRDPRMPVRATVWDAVLQIVAVGAGASLGREGAPRQAGAAVGGWLAATFRLDAARRRTVLAAGAGAGLAAVYNVPLGGALFTAEVLLRSLAPRHLIPAAVTSAVATAVAWPALSTHATYPTTRLHLHLPVVAWAVLVGPICGVVGVGFVRLMSRARTHAPIGARLVVSIPLGFAAVGALAVVRPELLGNGKGPAQLAFTASMTVALGAALAALKPLATALCLRAGAIGGLLTPSVATGAALGIVTGAVWNVLWPGSTPAEYAVVAAAALLAATQRAPLTAAVLVIEFLGWAGWRLALPIALAVPLAAYTAARIDPALRPLITGSLQRPPRRFPTPTERTAGTDRRDG